MHYVTVHLLFCWAHERISFSPLPGRNERHLRETADLLRPAHAAKCGCLTNRPLKVRATDSPLLRIGGFIECRVPIN
jgi:hypothetical protein